jgi:hypothetical protein
MANDVYHMFPDIYYMMGAPTYHPGFFSCFQSLIGFLDTCEQNSHIGYKVFFERGLYFNAAVGPNWWEYYFEPIECGVPDKKIEHISDTLKSRWTIEAISIISRERAAELTNRYIKLKPHMQNKIDQFIAKEFRDNYIIGIHYRGCDKSSEAPRVPFSDVRDAVIKAIDNRSKVGIFVATDEQGFLDYMVQQFGSKVIYIRATRSRNQEPIHHVFGQSMNNGSSLGEEAVLDCYLLSKTNIMIRTASNLSSSAANMNPSLPVIDLNKAHFVSGIR